VVRHILAILTVTLAGALQAQAARIDDAREPALVLGSDGLGLVAYQDTATLDLKVAHCVDAACIAVTTVTVDSTGDVGSRAAIALLPGGLPVISYADKTNNTIKLAFCVDTVCSAATTVVIESGLLPGGSGHTSVAIGGDGRPLIAYSTATPASAENGRLHVAHCASPGCTSVTVTDLAPAQQETTLGVGGDGRGVIVSVRRFDTDYEVDFRHCNDVACTSATLNGPNPIAGPRPSHAAGDVPTVHFYRNPSLAVGPDGLATYVYTATASFAIGLQVVKCLDFACTTFTLQHDVAQATGPSSLAIDAAGRPRVAVAHLGISAPAPFGEAQFFECNDATCTTFQQACTASWANHPSLALDGAGQPLVALEVPERVEILRPGSCQPTFFIDGVAASYEGNPPDPGFFMPFPVRLFPPPTAPITVAYTTADVTALAGSDYVGASGLITFAPGETTQGVLVRTIPDATVEPDETFQVVLSAPGGNPIAQGVGVGLIANDDQPPQPTVDIADCAVTEGNTGTTGCTFDVRLSLTYPRNVTVAFATSDGTAVAGSDYLAQSGTLTFAAGTTTQTVSVSVVGDLATERDEFFHLTLSQPVNALPGDMTADGNILDDDWPVLPGLELTHGSALVADFQPDPGPTADRDDYRVAQAPYSSYEAVLDAVSGDAAPGATLERIAADGTTVLGSGDPVGTGSAQSLRFTNAIGATVGTQYLRVRGASCGTACGSDDTYRLRLHETTGRIPRFNNSFTQITVLILQNTTGAIVTAEAHFWGTDGQLLLTQSLLTQPRGTIVFNTATAGTSGSITVTHNGPYGALAGKAVALEPSTGFSFDSPMVSRPR
jgi:Calx-beta domain